MRCLENSPVLGATVNHPTNLGEDNMETETSTAETVHNGFVDDLHFVPRNRFMTADIVSRLPLSTFTDPSSINAVSTRV